MIIVLITLTLLGHVSAAKLNPLAMKLANECFSLIERRGVSNASPVAELWNVSPFDCLSYCVLNIVKSGDGCASVVYHQNFRTCQLYNHDGNYEGSKIVFASGHDYYNRTKFDGVCADPSPPSRPYPQGQVRPKVHADASVQPARPILGRKLVKAEKKPENYLLSVIPTRRCNENETSSYIFLDGYDFAQPIKPRAVVNKIDREACSAYCTQGINKVGDRVVCTAFRHESAEDACELYDEEIKELGIFTRLQQKNGTHSIAERICIPRDSSCDDGISGFKLLHRSKVNGYIIGQVVNLETITDCLQICIGNSVCKVISNALDQTKSNTIPFPSLSYSRYAVNSATGPLTQKAQWAPIFQLGDSKYLHFQSVTFKKGRCTLHSVHVIAQNLQPADSSTAVIGKSCQKL